jgi:hypothetical protein
VRRNNRFVPFVIAALPLVEFACGSSPSAPTANGPFTVSGRVLDFQTNTGVSGATVVFADPSNTTVIVDEGRSITDSSGLYQISLMAGLYSVYVDAAYGGLARVRTGNNRADLLVHPNGCIVRYGTIADSSTGRPLAGATVSLVGVTAPSGSDGGYRLDFGCRTGMWSGTIALSVTRAGYQDGGVPMGRGEGLSGVIRQDVDLAPR